MSDKPVNSIDVYRKFNLTEAQTFTREEMAIVLTENAAWQQMYLDKHRQLNELRGRVMGSPLPTYGQATAPPPPKAPKPPPSRVIKEGRG